MLMRLFSSQYGGSAIAISYSDRRVTRDVDISISSGTEILRKAASEMAIDLDWPDDWMNDAVKGFVSANPKLNKVGVFKGEDGTNRLTIFTPTIEYLLAMKCMSMRIGVEGNDIQG